MSFRSVVTLASALAVWSAAAAAETIKIGVTPGPHAQILEAVKPIAAKGGLDIQLIEFSDYVVPNAALDAGDIQANSFQNQPYLDNQKADRGYKIESVGLTVNFPIGVYSKKHKAWADIPDGGKVSIPNDPTNGGRVLLLLRDKGVIKLKDGVGFKPSVVDITENPKKLTDLPEGARVAIANDPSNGARGLMILALHGIIKLKDPSSVASTIADITDNPRKLRFVELDAAQLPRSLQDVDLVSINNNYAVQAGLNPAADAIAREAADGPWVNIIAVREEDKDKPWVKQLVDAYHSDEVKAFLDKRFKGTYIATW